MKELYELSYTWAQGKSRLQDKTVNFYVLLSFISILVHVSMEIVPNISPSNHISNERMPSKNPDARIA